MLKLLSQLICWVRFNFKILEKTTNPRILKMIALKVLAFKTWKILMALNEKLINPKIRDKAWKQGIWWRISTFLKKYRSTLAAIPRSGYLNFSRDQKKRLASRRQLRMGSNLMYLIKIIIIRFISQVTRTERKSSTTWWSIHGKLSWQSWIK